MSHRFLILTLAALGACAPDEAPEDVGDAEARAVSAATVEEHMRRLSADEFMGRGPGHPGGDMAAEYIAAQFEAAGLQPVDGSYFQNVPMIGSTTASDADLVFRGPEGTVDPEYLDEFVLNPGDPEATSAAGEAEVVFAGYGIVAPEADWNDFEGIDARGKFLLVLVNDPPASEAEPDLFGGPAMTYYGRWTYKYEEAARQGALGVLIVHETEPAGYPWSVVRGGWSGEQFALPPDPGGPGSVGMSGWVTEETARELLALAGHDFGQLKERAASRDFEAVATGVTATARLSATTRTVETRNVVGRLEGTTRPDEVVTLTSHYDHFGVGEAIDGDSIYNGAYDNASGTALLMGLADALAAVDGGLDRSLLFIATAAEEQGLLGAQWYVQSPLVPLERTVAEVNVDGANLWGETDDVTVHGTERSELGAFVRPHAAALDLEIVPDQEPEKGFFFRSDHFPFARAGVPSLYVEHGRGFRGQEPGWGQDILDRYTAERYHAPGDEYSEDFTFEGAVQQGELVYRIVRDLARSDAWPAWHEGQEFKAARDDMMGTAGR